jgi:hypothetical protein
MEEVLMETGQVYKHKVVTNLILKLYNLLSRESCGKKNRSLNYRNIELKLSL